MVFTTATRRLCLKCSSASTTWTPRSHGWPSWAGRRSATCMQRTPPSVVGWSVATTKACDLECANHPADDWNERQLMPLSALPHSRCADARGPAPKPMPPCACLPTWSSGSRRRQFEVMPGRSGGVTWAMGANCLPLCPESSRARFVGTSDRFPTTVFGMTQRQVREDDQLAPQIACAATVRNCRDPLGRAGIRMAHQPDRAYHRAALRRATQRVRQTERPCLRESTAARIPAATAPARATAKAPRTSQSIPDTPPIKIAMPQKPVPTSNAPMAPDACSSGRRAAPRCLAGRSSELTNPSSPRSPAVQPRPHLPQIACAAAIYAAIRSADVRMAPGWTSA